MSNDAKTKEKVRIAVFFSLCILLVVGIFVSIGSGTVSLSVSETWATLLGEADADTDRIVNLIRLPRTIVTVLVGANLVVVTLADTAARTLSVRWKSPLASSCPSSAVRSSCIC